MVVDWLARGNFTDCLKAGMRVFGYRHMLHAKTCTIDGQWSTVGTANLDRLSSVGNYEINYLIREPLTRHTNLNQSAKKFERNAQGNDDGGADA